MMLTSKYMTYQSVRAVRTVKVFMITIRSVNFELYVLQVITDIKK